MADGAACFLEAIPTAQAEAVTGGGAERTTLTATARRIMEARGTPHGRYRAIDSPAFTPADVGTGLPLGCAEPLLACFARLRAFFLRQCR